MKEVTIYTDGACSGNPGPGGWGAILKYGEHMKELSGGEAVTTNNRMELTGVITALSALKEPCYVNLYTDSQYIANAINEGWLKKWVKCGWRRQGAKVKNVDLWEKLLLLDEINDIKFVWVKGHDGHEYNERCDKNAVECAENPTEYDKEEK